MIYNESRMIRSIGRYVAPVIFLVAIIIFGGVGIAFVASTKHKEKVCTDEALAVIYEVEKNVDTENDSTSYKLLFRYEYKGKEYEGESNLSSSSYKSFKANDKIDIKVNPENPSEYIYDIKGNYIFGYIFVGVGALMIVFFIISIVVLLRRRR